jgi:hypothetical protein
MPDYDLLRKQLNWILILGQKGTDDLFDDDDDIIEYIPYRLDENIDESNAHNRCSRVPNRIFPHSSGIKDVKSGIKLNSKDFVN